VCAIDPFPSEEKAMKGKISLLAALLLTGASAFAAVFGSVRGIVHDAQHRPVENAMVMLRANTSDWAASAYTDANGQFVFNAVGIGEYTVTIAAPGVKAKPIARRPALAKLVDPRPCTST